MDSIRPLVKLYHTVAMTTIELISYVR